MRPGDYLTRRDAPAGAGAGAAAVVLGVAGGSVDVLTFGGMRSLELLETIERLWVVTPRPVVAREIPLQRGQAPGKLFLKASGKAEVVDLWPWNDAAEAIANLARCGLRLGKLRQVRRVSIQPTQLQVFEVEGTYREPIGFVDFPPFAEADPWKRT